MKVNKGKEIVGEEGRPEAQPQTRSLAGEKRKSLSKNIDLGSLPSQRDSRREKRVKHGLSQGVKPHLPPSQTPVHIVDIDSSTPIESTPSKASPPRTTIPALSQLPPRVPMNIIENEDLAWKRIEEAIKDKDITICYDMSLKDFEHLGVHDLFKVLTIPFASSSLFHNFFFV